jgi:hypothetical protein
MVAMEPTIKDGSCHKIIKQLWGKYYYVVDDDTYFYPHQRGV